MAFLADILAVAHVGIEGLDADALAMGPLAVDDAAGAVLGTGNLIKQHWRNCSLS